MVQEREFGSEGKIDLCLEFADTVDWRTCDHPQEGLRSYADLLAWSRKNGLVGEEEAERLGRLGEREAETALKEARELRESIYRMFSAAAHQRRARLDDVRVLNDNLSRGLARTMVMTKGSGYVWAWHDDGSADAMLFPVARSAAELLTSGELSTVKECANEEQGCGSLFIDRSKGQSRRWCSMKSCGNRMKFRAFYERKNKAKQPTVS
jgi:predicted RNA-binding Zn ribbon-like protein